uniref:Uncharacterized protein n=1 Tax=Anguilla anguilla TaxID=7936 RepID=A0A0E9PXC2_ANGAN
MPFYVGTVL